MGYCLSIHTWHYVTYASFKNSSFRFLLLLIERWLVFELFLRCFHISSCFAFLTLFYYIPTADPGGNPKKLISRMEDAKYCGRDWIPTGNWPQVRYNPAYNRTTPDNLAQVLRCGSSHPSLPLLYLPTSFTLSLSQLGIFQGHYKVWE